MTAAWNWLWCNVQDIKWKPRDVEKDVLEHIMRWAAKKRGPAVRDEIKKVCRRMAKGSEYAVQHHEELAGCHVFDRGA